MKPAANKAPEALFDLDAEQSVTTIHNRHLTPTFNLDNDDDDSEGLAPAANPRPATPPHRKLHTDAASDKSSKDKASPPQDEEVGVLRAAGGG
jgi:hypothetical protein